MISTACTARSATPSWIKSARGTVVVHGIRPQDLPDVGRRGTVVGGGLLLSALLLPDLASADSFNFTIAPEKLSAGQVQQQRQQIRDRADKALGMALTADDAPLAMRLAFNDAATYDYATRSGGLDGSIVTEDELKRPENAMLQPLVTKLTEVKKQIDEQNTVNDQSPISWADLIVLAARIATGKQWRQAKRKRTASDEDAAFMDITFGAEWPIKLGRVDSMSPGAAGRIPSADASVEDIKSFLLGLGSNPDGGFGYKPPFYERPGFVMYTAAQPDPVKAEEYLATDPEFAKWKVNYDKSRRTLTRTNYEVDFITYFNRLTSLGAKFDKLAYLKPVVVKSKGV